MLFDYLDFKGNCRLLSVPSLLLSSKFITKDELNLVYLEEHVGITD